MVIRPLALALIQYNIYTGKQSGESGESVLFFRTDSTESQTVYRYF